MLLSLSCMFIYWWSKQIMDTPKVDERIEILYLGSPAIRSIAQVFLSDTLIQSIY